jgi:hypothetical protein
MTFQKPALLPSIRQEAPNLSGTLDQAILSLVAPANSSSPRIATGKWLLKN